MRFRPVRVLRFSKVLSGGLISADLCYVRVGRLDSETLEGEDSLSGEFYRLSSGARVICRAI